MCASNLPQHVDASEPGPVNNRKNTGSETRAHDTADAPLANNKEKQVTGRWFESSLGSHCK
jgi:cation transport regulator ChaB